MGYRVLAGGGDSCGEEAIWQPGQPAMCDTNSLCAENRSFHPSDGKERRRTYQSWAGERESYFKRSHSHAAVGELLQTNSVVPRRRSGTGFQHRFQHRVTSGRPWKRGEIHPQVLSARLLPGLGCVVPRLPAGGEAIPWSPAPPRPGNISGPARGCLNPK